MKEFWKALCGLNLKQKVVFTLFLPLFLVGAVACVCWGGLEAGWLMGEEAQEGLTEWMVK